MNIDSICYAPGKIILCGEHAVVYGSKAIALPLDRGIRVATSKCHENYGPFINSHGLGLSTVVNLRGEGPIVLQKMLTKLVEIFGPKICSIEFKVDSQIPAGRGMGSSASLSVALLKSITRYFDNNVDVDFLLKHAMDLENIFHGTASGVDHSVVSLNKPLLFSNRENKTQLTPMKLQRQLNFVVGLSHPHIGTSNAVQKLSKRMQSNKKLYNYIFDGINDICLCMLDACESGELYKLGELMDLNQGYLNSLGVSTPQLETLCSIARSKGALGAKLTGAGCGGAVIALVEEDDDSVLKGFQCAGFEAFKTEILPIGK